MTDRKLSEVPVEATSYPCPDCVNGPTPMVGGTWQWTLGGPPPAKGTGWRTESSPVGNWASPPVTMQLVKCERCNGTGLVANRRLRVSYVLNGSRVDKVIGPSEDRRKNGDRDRRSVRVSVNGVDMGPPDIGWRPDDSDPGELQ